MTATLTPELYFGGKNTTKKRLTSREQPVDIYLSIATVYILNVIKQILYRHFRKHCEKDGTPWGKTVI